MNGHSAAQFKVLREDAEHGKKLVQSSFFKVSAPSQVDADVFRVTKF